MTATVKTVFYWAIYAYALVLVLDQYVDYRPAAMIPSVLKSPRISPEWASTRLYRGGRRKQRPITVITGIRPENAPFLHNDTKLAGFEAVQVKITSDFELSSLKCLLLNARSVCNKTIAISEHIIETSCDFALTTETWLKTNDRIT